MRRNLKEQKLQQNSRIGYFVGKKEDVEYQWTIYCKMPDDKRGEYSEEIDVGTWGRQAGEAMTIAKMALKAHYVPELRTSRIERIL